MGALNPKQREKLIEKKLQELGILKICSQGHNRQFLMEDGWIYIVCTSCLDRTALTISQMESFRALSGTPKDVAMFRIFGREHAALYNLLEEEALLKHTEPEEFMFSILEAYLVRLASKRSGYKLSARRQGIYYRHKNGMPPDEIAADMNLHVSTVKDTLTKVGLFTPRTYKKHLTGEPA